MLALDRLLMLRKSGPKSWCFNLMISRSLFEGRDEAKRGKVERHNLQLRTMSITTEFSYTVNVEVYQS